MTRRTPSEWDALREQHALDQRQRAAVAAAARPGRGRAGIPRRATSVHVDGTKALVQISGCDRPAIVDAQDAEWVALCRWHLNSGYARTFLSRYPPVSRYMHQILGERHGLGTRLDHANGDRLDNRLANLRPASLRENASNGAKHRDSSSPYKGIFRAKRAGAWGAQIVAAGTHYSLGVYTTPEEAARAYDSAALYLHGAFARCNFPDGVPRDPLLVLAESRARRDRA